GGGGRSETALRVTGGEPARPGGGGGWGAAGRGEGERPEWNRGGGKGRRGGARGPPIAARARNGRRDRGKSPRGWEAGGRSQNLPSPVSLARIRLSRALLSKTVQQRPIDLVARRERQFVDEPD